MDFWSREVAEEGNTVKQTTLVMHTVLHVMSAPKPSFTHGEPTSCDDNEQYFNQLRHGAFLDDHGVEQHRRHRAS